MSLGVKCLINLYRRYDIISYKNRHLFVPIFVFIYLVFWIGFLVLCCFSICFNYSAAMTSVGASVFAFTNFCRFWKLGGGAEPTLNVARKTMRFRS